MRAEWLYAKASVFNEARKQIDGRSKPFLFMEGQLNRDLFREPILPCGTTIPEQLLTLPGEGHQGLPSIVRVRRAPHQPGFQQRRDDGAHRLRTHSLTSSQARYRCRTVFLDTKQNGDLRRPQIAVPTLFAQLPLEFARNCPKLCCQFRGALGLRRTHPIIHGTQCITVYSLSVQVNCIYEALTALHFSAALSTCDRAMKAACSADRSAAK